MGLMQGKIKILKNLLFGQINHESVKLFNNKILIDNNKNIAKTTETTEFATGAHNRFARPHLLSDIEGREFDNSIEEPQPANALIIPQM
jgi:hypothetical protein